MFSLEGYCKHVVLLNWAPLNCFVRECCRSFGCTGDSTESNWKVGGTSKLCFEKFNLGSSFIELFPCVYAVFRPVVRLFRPASAVAILGDLSFGALD